MPVRTLFVPVRIVRHARRSAPPAGTFAQSRSCSGQPAALIP
ncbi:hypothetical protein BSIN_2842 [Burkholderia singularis]|uniref:Uncharacterized protein n=1 Tax=Burkholderia singularis TaxID=1503053 RepID=A0A238H386_9BURK|nr:hypothetical protein BSIN_2842 [Burkholderia singularis]